MIRLFAIATLALLLTACGGSATPTRAVAPTPRPTPEMILQPEQPIRERRAVEAWGTIRAQGLTAYGYGTHVLLSDGGRTLYALRAADRRRLDESLGRRVRVAGETVPGYPLDGGPILVEVTAIEVAP